MITLTIVVNLDVEISDDVENVINERMVRFEEEWSDLVISHKKCVTNIDYCLDQTK